MKSYCRLAFVLAALCLGHDMARAFVLIGPVNPSIASAGRLQPPGTAGAAATPNPNLDDPMGWPTPVKEFHRWNYPELTYAYDSTFIRYFGHNGMGAISNAFSVLNDFFAPEDKAYTNGVSSLNLITEYDQHFSTWEFNPSANINAVTDMESITLGLLVNHLGLGNPHRYCFVIHDVLNYAAAAFPNPSTGTFQVLMRNYDPYTYQTTSVINGVTHSYWLYNDSSLAVGNITIWDAVEYTVQGDHQYSAIAAIRDVINFGGMPWPSVAPTVFRTPGVFFRPDYSGNQPAPPNVGGKVRSQPRHTLTFDDAGGLKYLYRTNNVVFEQLDATVTLVTPANMNPAKAEIISAVPPNSPFLTPQRRTIAGIIASAFTPVPQTGGSIRPNPTTIVGGAATPAAGAAIQAGPNNQAAMQASQIALRGGINKIKFVYRGYDSLIGQDFLPHVSIWTDVFITNAVENAALVYGNPPYFTQIVQRTTTSPDIIFTAYDLGVLGAQPNEIIPVINIPDTTGWVTFAGANTQQAPAAGVAVMQGPGTILPPAANTSIVYSFTTRAPFHQVVWTGEPGIEGNFVVQFQWGWITNTGPEDYIVFPESDITQMEAVTAPSGTVVAITHIDIINGVTGEIRADSEINRTVDTVHLYGIRMDTVTEIQIMDVSGLQIVQRINPRSYIMSDQLIRLPPGVLSTTAEHATDQRTIRMVNPKGEGALYTFAKVNAGRPLIFSTQYDGLPLNTRKSLLIRGSGFITAAGGVVDQIEFYDDNNATNYEQDPPDYVLQNAQDNNASGRKWTVTDTTIFIPADYFSENNATVWGVTIGLANNNVIRSDGNNTDVTIDTFARSIRVKRGAEVNGRSPARPNVHKFTHVGVGGERNGTLALQSVFPRIREVFTTDTIPGPPVSTVDANQTWVRGDSGDTLIIRGTGLDLALSIEFVDGDGALIQSTDNLGLPPAPISLRNNVQASVLQQGVTLQAWTDPNNSAGTDGFEIRIDPVAFGMNTYSLFDSISGTNFNPRRRLVIRTPFGTAIAKPEHYIFIQN